MCDHINFHVHADVQKFLYPEGIVKYRAKLEAWCKDCNTPLVFSGCEAASKEFHPLTIPVTPITTDEGRILLVQVMPDDA